MLRLVAIVRTDVSEELIAFIIKVITIGELGTTLSVSKYRITLRRKTMPVLKLRSVLRLLVTANIVPSSPILIKLMTEETRSSETSVLKSATRRNIPEDVILKVSELSVGACDTIGNMWPKQEQASLF
jgi:hypothetical protein